MSCMRALVEPARLEREVLQPCCTQQQVGGPVCEPPNCCALCLSWSVSLQLLCTLFGNPCHDHDRDWQTSSCLLAQCLLCTLTSLVCHDHDRVCLLNAWPCLHFKLLCLCSSLLVLARTGFAMGSKMQRKKLWPARSMLMMPTCLPTRHSGYWMNSWATRHQI